MLILLFLVRDASACTWVGPCSSLELPDGMTAEFAPGDAIPLDNTVGCRVESAELIDAADVAVPLEVVLGPDESLTAFPVPIGTPPGEYTLVASIPPVYESRAAVTVVAPRAPGAAVLGAISLGQMYIEPAFETNFYCSGDAGWGGSATVHIESAPGPGWLVRVAASPPERASRWVPVPAGGPATVTGGVLARGYPASGEGCVEIGLYDPALHLVATSAAVCAALPPEPVEPGDTDDPGDVEADAPTPPAPAREGKGCATAPGRWWLAWVPLVLARRRRGIRGRRSARTGAPGSQTGWSLKEPDRW